MLSKHFQNPRPSFDKDVTRHSKNQAPSILAEDIVIVGDINTLGDVQIEGRLEGNIVANSIIVGTNGSISGTIRAENIFVRGKVSGKIDADTITLGGTANVLADITQNKFVVENGALFDGKCQQKETNKTPIISLASH